jgi:hypothetical protein
MTKTARRSALLIATLLIIVPGAASAAPVLPAVTYTVNNTTNNTEGNFVSVYSGSIGQITTPDEPFTGTPINNGTSVGDAAGVAQASAALGPVPTVSATTAVSACCDPAGAQAEAYAGAAMNFEFYIAGPAGVVPVTITAFGNIVGGVTGVADLSIYTTNPSVPVNDTNPVFESAQAGDPQYPTSWSLQSDFNLYTNAVYTVSMIASSESFAQSNLSTSMNGFATVDPMFSIDSNFANASDYSFQFSPGIENLDATPIPGTLPLFATGLGGLGLLGWRRKRNPPVSLLGDAWGRNAISIIPSPSLRSCGFSIPHTRRSVNSAWPTQEA